MKLARPTLHRLSLLAACIAVAVTGMAIVWRFHGGQANEALPSVPAPTATASLVTDVTEASGLEFVHTVEGGYFFPDIMCSGGALVDFDCDGDLDIYLVNGSSNASNRNESDATPAPAVNRLYEQEPNGHFRDVTDSSGLGDDGYGMGVAIGDVNNDSFPDIYVTNYGPDRLFLNQGDGTFLDVTASAGLDNPRWGASACFFDYDRDGWLDLFVTNYADYHEDRRCYGGHGNEDFCSPDVFPATADKLYQNMSGELRAEGEPNTERKVAPVRFTDVSFTSGIALKPGLGLGVVCADFNADHWPDIYVANDRQANFLWLNGRDGTFRDEAILQGVAYDGAGQPQAGMGVACGDVNGDGRFDLLVTHMRGESYAFYLSDMSGFTEAASSAGIAGHTFTLTGFGTGFADLDHDGDLDLVVVNGRVERPPPGAAESEPPDQSRPASDAVGDFRAMYAEKNQILLNEGNGRFAPFTSTSDPFINDFAVSRGLALGDVDNDGDLDILVINASDRARLYRNDSAEQGNWLLVRAIDSQVGNRDVYGAVVTVTSGQTRWTRLVNPGFSYCSSNDPRAHFGLGKAAVVDRIEVLWPDGSAESFDGGPVNRLRVLERGRGRAI